MTKNKYNAIIDALPASEIGIEVLFRQAGDEWLQVEYCSANALDYMLNFRVQVSVKEIENRAIRGVIETMSAFKTSSYHFDPLVISLGEMVEIAKDVEMTIGGQKEISRSEFTSTLFEMPIAFEDSQTREAVAKYLKEIKSQSVDCDPVRLSNLKYVAQYNGISIEEYKEKFLSTEFFIFLMGFSMGLPAYMPLDLRCLLRTSKYNPPRTWTPRSEIGHGGFDFSIYSVPGPGGYHMIGRTCPIVLLSQKHPDFRVDPILFSVGDRIKWYEVEEEELLRVEKAVDEGSPEFRYKKTPGKFSVAEWLAFNEEHKSEIEAWQKHITEAAALAPAP